MNWMRFLNEDLWSADFELPSGVLEVMIREAEDAVIADVEQRKCKDLRLHILILDLKARLELVESR